MRRDSPIGPRPRPGGPARSLAALLALCAPTAIACLAGRPRAARAGDSTPKAPKDNSLCYVCHLDLRTEEIAAVHLKEEIACADCHGPSFDHMHDEMLMTKPDVLFGRTEVDVMCKRCHDPHENPAAVKAFLEKWRGRDRPNGRVITERSICTDCHGLHNIVKKMGSASKQEEAEAKWIQAFDGRDLAGWRPDGAAAWTVRRGRIVGTPGPRGGDLLSDARYADFLLSVTYRADGPIRAAIELRGAGGPRVLLAGPGDPSAHPGSVHAPGGAFALANLRTDLFDPEGWNTVSVRAIGDRFQVWLNGEEIGAVRVPGPARGRIGIHLEATAGGGPAELAVREVLVRPIAPKAEGGAKP